MQAKVKAFYIKVLKLNKFLKKINFNPSFFILPSILSFCGAFFDGLSVALLVPLAKGVISMNFDFLKGWPIFKTIIYSFPQIFINTNRPNSSVFTLLVGIIFVSTLLKVTLLYFSNLYAHYQARQFGRDVRQAIFSKYLSFGKLFFDKTSTGHLNTTLLSFVDEISSLLTYLRTFVTYVFTVLIYLIIMCVISWQLTILTVLFFPILHYSLNWLIIKIRATSEIYAELKSKQGWKIFDTLSCITLVKAYSAEKLEEDNFSKINSSLTKTEFSIDKKQLLMQPIHEALTMILILVVISMIALVFVKGDASRVSKFLVFFYIIRHSTPLFSAIMQFKAQVAKIEGPMRKILKTFDDKDKPFIQGGQKEFAGLKEKIEIKNLNFSYTENIKVLKDVSLVVEKNKMTAIVGPTGSGKTTIINILMRLYKIPSNKVYIDGTDIKELSLVSLHAHMAMVSQEILLFNDTIKNNLQYGLKRKVSEEELMNIIKKAKLYDFITNLPDKLNTYIGERGIRLSGGERQRLSIARMLLKGAEILIMDEATSSLDSKTERLIQEAIDTAIKDRTAIIIAHRLSTIKHADKIVVIENGKIIEEGKLKELLDKQGKFYQYWEEQKFY